MQAVMKGMLLQLAFPLEKLSRLGKHKMGKGCLYIKKISDIDPAVLKELVQDSVSYIKETYPDSK